MEHENRVPQTGVSPQGWKETHTSPHKPVHAGSHTHTHTHTHTHIINLLATKGIKEMS